MPGVTSRPREAAEQVPDRSCPSTAPVRRGTVAREVSADVDNY